MSMTEAAQRIVNHRKHTVYLKSIGNSSGRYNFKCEDCGRGLDYYEGEWFGQMLDQDCKQSGGTSE